jgi:hypothetical protein
MCFLADTPVWVNGRLVRIENVLSGQMLSKLDCDSVTPDLGRIERLEEHEGIFERYDILLETGDCISIADSHYFMNDSGRWIGAQDLHSGLVLQSLQGPVRVARLVKQQKPFAGKSYNLKIEGSDRYFVGRQGIIVRDW